MKYWLVATYKINEIQSVESNLINQSFEYYLPKMVTKKYNNNPKEEVKFPGYIFIKTDIDKLNALINITVERNDYEEKVNEVLNGYRKKANIPGFRKGHVPISLIKKQYEQAVIADEVNKLLQDNIDKYIKINLSTNVKNPTLTKKIIIFIQRNLKSKISTL